MPIESLFSFSDQASAYEFNLQIEDTASEDTCDHLISAHRDGHLSAEQLVRGLKSLYHQQYVARATAAKVARLKSSTA